MERKNSQISEINVISKHGSFFSASQAAMGTMDGIIDTVSAPHSIPPLLALLKATGKMILVGLPEKPLEIPAFSLVIG